MNGDFYGNLVLGTASTPGLELTKFLQHLSMCHVLAEPCVVYFARRDLDPRFGKAKQKIWEPAFGKVSTMSP